MEEIRWWKQHFRGTHTLLKPGFGQPARRSLSTAIALAKEVAQEEWTLAMAGDRPRAKAQACHAEAFSVGGLDVNF
jgi:hypothetical protein